jgi:glutathione S-transferase
VTVTTDETTGDLAGNDQPIFHLALAEDWAEAFTIGEYRVSTRGMTLDEVGFIHCSTHAQIVDTANRFYGDLDQLVLLTVDPVLVPSPIVYEPPAPDLDELFPHVYGPLPIAAVVHTKTWLRPGGETWTLDD